MASLVRDLVPGRPLAAAAAGLGAACLPALLAQATIPDKYPLNLVLFLLLARALLAAARAPGGRDRDRDLAKTGFLGGVALAHHLMALYLAPGALALFWRDRRSRRPRHLAILAVLLALGLSVKPAVLPVLATRPTLMQGPLDGPVRLWRYLDARDYSGRFHEYSAWRVAKRFVTGGLGGLWRQLGPVGLLAAGAGILALRAAAAPALGAAAAAAGFALLLVARFDIAGVGYYLMPIAAIACVLAGAGLARLRDRLGPALGALGAGLYVAAAAARGLPHRDLSRYDGAVDWGRNLLASVPPGGILVTKHDDDFYPPMYLQRVLGERPDVILIHRPFLTRLWHHARVEEQHPGFHVLDPAQIPWGQVVDPESLVNLFLRSHQARVPRPGAAPVFQRPADQDHPVYFSYIASAEIAGGFTIVPDGAAFRIGRRETDPPLPHAAAFIARLERFRWRSVWGPYPPESRFAEVAGAPAASLTQLAYRWWAERDDLVEARACLAPALAFPSTRVVPEDVDRLARSLGLASPVPPGSDLPPSRL